MIPLIHCSKLMGLFIALLGLAPLQAATLVLTSHVGGVYDYGLAITDFELLLQQNQGVTISGLSGVTGASISSVEQGSKCPDTVSTTATSVSVTESGQCAAGNGNWPSPTPFVVQTIEIDSSIQTAGTVNYELNTSHVVFTQGGSFFFVVDPPFDSTTQGPIAPEPSTSALLGVGLLAIFSRRFRLFSCLGARSRPQWK